MRILKRVFIGLLVLLLLSVLSGYLYFKLAFKPEPDQLALADKNVSIPFQWQGDTLNGAVEPYAAMLLPVTLKGCPRTFYMQFDLGAPSSLFYKSKLDAINQQYHNLSFQHEEEDEVLRQYQFTLGKNAVTTQKITVKQVGRSGINWSDTTGKEIIGTIGTDLFDGKVLVIDYQKNSLYIGDKVPQDLLAHAKFTGFKYESRRVLLPAEINGEEEDIFFDSGTSAFELVTDKKTWDELSRKGAKVVRYPASSWNNELMVNTTETEHTIKFQTVEVPLRHVTYVEGTSFLQQMLFKVSGVGGMTGNKLFLNKIVVLDTKNSQFAIIE